MNQVILIAILLINQWSTGTLSFFILPHAGRRRYPRRLLALVCHHSPRLQYPLDPHLHLHTPLPPHTLLLPRIHLRHRQTLPLPGRRCNVWERGNKSQSVILCQYVSYIDMRFGVEWALSMSLWLFIEISPILFERFIACSENPRGAGGGCCCCCVIVEELIIIGESMPSW